jgi:hypothetical protein
MISDSERGINEGLNFLVALGLSTYRDSRRSMLWKLTTNYKLNYDRFIKNYFDKKCGCEYMKVGKRLSPLGGYNYNFGIRPFSRLNIRIV